MAEATAPRQITKDHLYDAVPPTDFGAMLDIDRHMTRSTAFDRIISATHDHFWDPLDKQYIDFDEPFDLENEELLPDEYVPALATDYVTNHFADKPKERLRFKSQMARWQMSAILHGRSRRAGIRRQSVPRGRPSCHRLREIHPCALGLAVAVRRGAGQSPAGDCARARGL
jgi:hypothetical protein